MKRFRVLSHTADLRLKIFGKNETELFQNAALALAYILFNDIERRLRFIRGYDSIRAEAADINTLLVNFLNELLTRSNVQKKVYPRLKILRFSPQVIEAQAAGFPVDYFDEDVKAVSYHEAAIKKNKRGILETTLVLDI